MAPKRPTLANWKMDEMLAWLADLDQQTVTSFGETGSAYVHQHVLSFSNQKQKDEWKRYEESSELRDTFQKPNKVAKGKGRSVWVFLCDTPNESYVGKSLPAGSAPGTHQWDLVSQHAWAASVVTREGKGKDLYVFDCDMELPIEAGTASVKGL